MSESNQCSHILFCMDLNSKAYSAVTTVDSLILSDTVAFLQN